MGPLSIESGQRDVTIEMTALNADSSWILFNIPDASRICRQSFSLPFRLSVDATLATALHHCELNTDGLSLQRMEIPRLARLKNVLKSNSN